MRQDRLRKSSLIQDVASIGVRLATVSAGVIIGEGCVHSLQTAERFSAPEPLSDYLERNGMPAKAGQHIQEDSSRKISAQDHSDFRTSMFLPRDGECDVLVQNPHATLGQYFKALTGVDVPFQDTPENQKIGKLLNRFEIYRTALHCDDPVDPGALPAEKAALQEIRATSDAFDVVRRTESDQGAIDKTEELYHAALTMHSILPVHEFSKYSSKLDFESRSTYNIANALQSKEPVDPGFLNKSLVDTEYARRAVRKARAGNSHLSEAGKKHDSVTLVRHAYTAARAIISDPDLTRAAAPEGMPPGAVQQLKSYVKAAETLDKVSGGALNLNDPALQSKPVKLDQVKKYFREDNTQPEGMKLSRFLEKYKMPGTFAQIAPKEVRVTQYDDPFNGDSARPTGYRTCQVNMTNVRLPYVPLNKYIEDFTGLKLGVKDTPETRKISIGLTHGVVAHELRHCAQGLKPDTPSVFTRLKSASQSGKSFNDNMRAYVNRREIDADRQATVEVQKALQGQKHGPSVAAYNRAMRVLNDEKHSGGGDHLIGRALREDRSLSADEILQYSDDIGEFKTAVHQVRDGNKAAMGQIRLKSGAAPDEPKRNRDVRETYAVARAIVKSDAADKLSPGARKYAHSFIKAAETLDNIPGSKGLGLKKLHGANIKLDLSSVGGKPNVNVASIATQNSTTKPVLGVRHRH